MFVPLFHNSHWFGAVITATSLSQVNSNHDTDVHFHDVYSENEETLNCILEKINVVWETRFANGRKKNCSSLIFTAGPECTFFLANNC